MPLTFAVRAMATRFELVLDDGDEPRARAVAEAAFDEILGCERLLTLFRRDSLLARINRCAHPEWVPLDADTFELLEACVAIGAASRGAFDVTVAPRMRQLGLHDSPVAPGPVVGMAAVQLDRDRGAVRFRQPGVALDLGAIAKGHALDLAAAVLRAHGAERALLHGGGSSVVAIGAPPGEDGWRVALGGDGTAPTAVLRDAALAVSAPHGRRLERDGEVVTHVLDPRTGQPARGARLAAVIATSARSADAWSTALLVGGADLAPPADLTAVIATAHGWTTGGAPCVGRSRFVFDAHCRRQT